MHYIKGMDRERNIRSVIKPHYNEFVCFVLSWIKLHYITNVRGRGRKRDGLIPRRNIEKRIHMNDQLYDQRGHLSNRITRLRSFRPSVRPPVACTSNGQPSFKRKSLALQFHILADIIYVHFIYTTFKHFWPHCWPTSLPMNERRLFSHCVALVQVFMYVSKRISETSGCSITEYCVNTRI